MKKMARTLVLRRDVVRALVTEDLERALGGSLGPTHSDACSLATCLTQVNCPTQIACNK